MKTTSPHSRQKTQRANKSSRFHVPFLAFGFSASLLLASPTAHAAELEASDGAEYDYFGRSVSQSGSIGLVGAYADDNWRGSAYAFRNLDTASGTIMQNVKLIASDGADNDQFGYSVSQSGSIGLVGASGDDIGANIIQGSAYVFRNLDTASGTVMQNVKLIASDAEDNHQFGSSVSQSGNIGLVGAYGDDNFRGAAYVFRNLNTAIGQVTQNVKLIASDNEEFDSFGSAVSQSGSIGLVGASGNDTYRGSAYVFRNLDTATGTVTQNVKLIASDGAADDYLGSAVSQSGSIGLVGASGDGTYRGSAYVFRNLDTATGTVTQNIKLTASDSEEFDSFGSAVSQSGSIGLVGASGDDTYRGSAYVFRNLDAATGTVTQNVKLTASDGAESDEFGQSVSLDGDNFLIGATLGDGLVAHSGKAYSGSVSSITTLDAGSALRTIDGISFVSQDNWIIGETTDSNQVTLSTGDTANVTANGKAVYIGKNAGSDNNTLVINGTLFATTIYVGANGNTGNSLELGASGSVTADEIVFAGGNAFTGNLNIGANDSVGGSGTINGDLNLLSDAKFVFSLTETLTVTGSVSLTSTFGIDDLIGLDRNVALGTYTLINGTATDFAALGLENWGANQAYDLGGGKSAYFEQGSLNVKVVPEPGTCALVGLGLSALLLRRRRTV